MSNEAKAGAAAAQPTAAAKKKRDRRVSARPAHRPRKGEEHKRTAETARIVQVMCELPSVTRAQIARALGIGLNLLDAKYGDLPLPSQPGRKAHVVTDLSRQMVQQHVGLGLTHDEIAGLLGIDASTLEEYYADELKFGRARTIAAVGSKILVKALGNGPDSFNAAKFYLAARAKWGENLNLGLNQPAPAPAGPPLVDGEPREITRADARRVAFMLARAEQQRESTALVARVVDDEPAEPQSPGR